MKKVIALFIMLSMVICIGAQNKRTTTATRKTTTTAIKKTTTTAAKKTTTTAAKKTTTTKAVSGFKNVQELEDWLELKSFIDNDNDILTYSDGQISYAEGSDPEEPKWTVKNGVGYCTCAFWAASVEVHKEKKIIKVIPRFGDVIIYKFLSEDELPSNDN